MAWPAHYDKFRVPRRYIKYSQILHRCRSDIGFICFVNCQHSFARALEPCLPTKVLKSSNFAIPRQAYLGHLFCHLYSTKSVCVLSPFLDKPFYSREDCQTDLKAVLLDVRLPYAKTRSTSVTLRTGTSLNLVDNALCAPLSRLIIL